MDQDTQPAASTIQLNVTLATPSVAELRLPLALDGAGPSVPGGGILLGLTPQEQPLLCAGFLPCGECGPCRAAAHLSCLSPTRPGTLGVPGGLAGQVTLPVRFLAPPHDLFQEEPETMAGPLALIAAAGPTYQAAVLAGAVPGDRVLLAGKVDPEALPWRLLSTMGLRPVLLADAAIPGVGRFHLLDLNPSEQSLCSWLPLAGSCLTCTLVAPTPAGGAALIADLTALLAGQTPARWVKDLHPHLALDLLALARRMDLRNAARLCSPAELADVLPSLDPLASEPWPVAQNQ